MAEFKTFLYGDFDTIIRDINAAVTGRSITATLEGSSDFRTASARCSVRVYERYSAIGKNRVSMSITLAESDGLIYLTAITSGGSLAVLFKINTLGEDAFLGTIRDVVAKYMNRR